MTCCQKSLARLYLVGVCRVSAIALMALPGVFIATNAAAQDAAAKPGVDVLIFTNGDQLTGTLLTEGDGTVTFHSDMTGDVKVEWKKIKSLRTGGKYAVITSADKLRVGRPAPQIP